MQDCRSQPKYNFLEREHPAPLLKIKHYFKVASTALLLSTSVVGVNHQAIAKEYYLVEPTSDFKDEEKRVADFAAERMRVRKKWDATISHFKNTVDSNDLEGDLKALSQIIVETKDIPVGVKLNDLVKTARAKKFDPNSPPRKKIIMSYWTTPVEMAYQDLFLAFKRGITPENLVSNLSIHLIPDNLNLRAFY